MSGTEDPDERVDEAAGPLVRPYTMTRGRTWVPGGTFDLISLVIATGAPLPIGFGPEHHAIIGLCQRPISVAELGAHMKLPLGAIRVLLGDLRDRQIVRVHQPTQTALPDDSIFEVVINGLRAL
jgi:hypothetical protein